MAQCLILCTPTVTTFSFLLLLLVVGSSRAFCRIPLSTTATRSATKKNDMGCVEHRLVGHVDQLQQQQQRQQPDAATSSTTLVPPPHLFRFPAPGGDICLVVDENGGYHAVRDEFPPLGLPVSESGIVDTQVNVIGDMLFGTRFHLSDGTVRGPWCPGGTAGPLLRIARRLHKMWIPFRRALPNSDDGPPVALQVLPVTVQPDGSLTVALPSPPPTASCRGGGEACPDEPLERTCTEPSWAASRGFAGYDH